jgi:hypothetical protein
LLGHGCECKGLPPSRTYEQVEAVGPISLSASGMHCQIVSANADFWVCLKTNGASNRAGGYWQSSYWNTESLFSICSEDVMNLWNKNSGCRQVVDFFDPLHCLAAAIVTACDVFLNEYSRTAPCPPCPAESFCQSQNFAQHLIMIARFSSSSSVRFVSRWK